jgi:hypothetical protein
MRTLTKPAKQGRRFERRPDLPVPCRALSNKLRILPACGPATSSALDQAITFSHVRRRPLKANVSGLFCRSPDRKGEEVPDARLLYERRLESPHSNLV